jgi:hypothetical protein
MGALRVCHYGEDNHEMSSIASDRRYWCQFESSISNNWTQKQKKKKKTHTHTHTQQIEWQLKFVTTNK